MHNTLIELWDRHNLLSSFKTEMSKKGYLSRDLYCIHVQLSLLDDIIKVESVSVLSELLKKTYFRLLKQIDKGIEYLPDILLNSEEWVLNPVEKDPHAWTSKDVLIFTTRTNIAVFSKVSRNWIGYRYIDGKWQ